jgi:hypothetical protein
MAFPFLGPRASSLTLVAARSHTVGQQLWTEPALARLGRGEVAVLVKARWWSPTKSGQMSDMDKACLSQL